MKRKWSEPTFAREQIQMLDVSLDEKIGKSPGLRFLDHFLREMDWNEWESKYASGGSGRPPHHPRMMAGLILYGLIDGAQSTRELEKCSRWRIDYQWLLDSRSIDHTTISNFRNRFESQIKDLFHQLNRHAAKLKKMTIEELVIDGTKIRAQSDRHGARTAKALQARLDRLEESIAEILKKMAEGEDLQPAYEKLQRAKKQDEVALAVAQKRDEKQIMKCGKRAKGVRVPVGDPDAHLTQNKEGGYAPNYTPVIGVEKQSGLIVAETISPENTEPHTVPELVKEANETQGKEVKRVVMDKGFETGEHLRDLEDAGIDSYVPVNEPKKNNPAPRAEPYSTVEKSQWENLPKNGKQLSRDAFIYDKEENQYYCPMGRILVYETMVTRYDSRRKKHRVRQYKSMSCEDCALSTHCLSRKAKQRRISRDEYEEVRERTAKRMESDEGQKIYKGRAPVVEGTIGTIKSAMKVRQFKRRGIKKVRADWTWVCSAYNLKKLMKDAANAARPLKSTIIALNEEILRGLKALENLDEKIYREIKYVGTA